jgi:hypothetical protein
MYARFEFAGAGLATIPTGSAGPVATTSPRRLGALYGIVIAAMIVFVLCVKECFNGDNAVL